MAGVDGGTVAGIHHVTAIAGSPSVNLDFYTRVLGMRLVKKTVNFDDPGSYHLYYGDEFGRPGTIMTFFPWPGAPRGLQGAGQATVTAFQVPADSIEWWRQRLAAEDVGVSEPLRRLGEEVLSFEDPHGLRLELVGVADDRGSSGDRGSTAVPMEHAISGFHGITITAREIEPTAGILVGRFRWSAGGEEAGRARFSAPGEGPGRHVDIVRDPDAPQGLVASGTVHHVAFRLPGDEAQAAFRTALVERGFAVSPVMDRQYFRSIYFREPGGVLFEMATDPPGFAVDEDRAELGASLKLPPWLESRRAEIAAALPSLDPVGAVEEVL